MSESVPANLVTQTWSKPLEPPESIPASADVVIIGGGIVGVSTAWFLAKQGVNVVLCEKGHIAGEQSGRNWGWLRQQCRDAREMPMVVESMKIWLPTAKAFGLDTRILTGEEVAQLARGASVTWKGGLYTASDGYAEPHKAAPAIARAAAREGATILTACAVRGLETEAGRVSAAVTEHGTIKTPVVLCAGGVWTSIFCRSIGISVPQLKVRGTVARTSQGESVLNGTVWGAQTGMRRRQDGGYTVGIEDYLDHSITPSTFRYTFKFLPSLVQDFKRLRLSIGRDFIDEWREPKQWRLDAESPFEKKRVLDPDPNPRAVKAIRKSLDSLFPQLADTEIVETWAGIVETTPDVIPVIDEADTIPGFHFATGFCGHGFGIGPGAGKAIAGMLTGTETGIDLSEFRLSRFFDGTKLRLYQKV